MSPRIGLSRFARERHRPRTGRSTFQGAEDELIALAIDHWEARRPGTGRRDTKKVVVIPVPPERFACATVLVGEDTPLEARLARRQPHEDPYIEVRAAAPAPRARHAALVLYSAATLLENGGERSGDFDWEIVGIQASVEADEPMHPLTMARNFLARPGGTPCNYTARQFAEAIDYWSRRCGILPDRE